ncbi:putative RNA-directed DNA polymerase from transposon BS [Caerostris extrusa]|uniref:RNA-directed DNA polymerase from transposon BS n=1 Tax=Caerostris extrusa TaxID=172846 RepID=A0AAV4V207_CAEEX|nr:putative RNA-directed DNA polymerase from transposon BS [Caerostris extrusa]
MLFSLFLLEEKRRCKVGIFADDVVLWHSDIKTIEADINFPLKYVSDFAEEHKLTFLILPNRQLVFYITTRHIYNYQPTIIMKGQALPYEKHTKYLGFTKDEEFLSSRHIKFWEAEVGRRQMF